jgi:hypothetical protein
MKQIQNSTESSKENCIERFDEAKTNLTIDLNNFNIKLYKSQFDAIIKVLNKFSNYQKFQNNLYETRKYKFFKPMALDGKSSYRKAYLKFAFEIILKQIKFNRGYLKAFDIPKSKMENYKKNFIEFFTLYIERNYEIKDFPEIEKKNVQKIIDVVDICDLYLWASIAIKNFFKNSKKEQNKNKIGTMWRLLGYKLTDEELLTKEEELKIEEILTKNLLQLNVNLENSQNSKNSELGLNLGSGLPIGEDTNISRPGNLDQNQNNNFKINKNEINLKIEFLLRDGSFEFWNQKQKKFVEFSDNLHMEKDKDKYNEYYNKNIDKDKDNYTNNNYKDNSYECFAMKYRDLKITMKTCERYSEYNIGLKEFLVEMFTMNGKNKEELMPLSFMENSQILKLNPKWTNSNGNTKRASTVFFEEIYVWKIVFRQYNNDINMNSDLDVYIVNNIFTLLFFTLFLL